MPKRNTPSVAGSSAPIRKRVATTEVPPSVLDASAAATPMPSRAMAVPFGGAFHSFPFPSSFPRKRESRPGQASKRSPLSRE